MDEKLMLLCLQALITARNADKLMKEYNELPQDWRCIEELEDIDAYYEEARAFRNKALSSALAQGWSALISFE